MAMMLESGDIPVVNLKIVGIGGGGCNAVSRMTEMGMEGAELVAMNTDLMALANTKATHKVQLGKLLVKGRGAGGLSDIGRRGAEESRDEIATALKGANMVFLTAGMGGGTGTGAIPVVAEVAREMNILTLAIVTKPFRHEKTAKMRQAEEGIEMLLQQVDGLIVIPNERIRMVSDETLTFANAFALADDVLYQCVDGMMTLVQRTGFINVDYSDIESTLRNAGRTHMAVSSAKGENMAVEAAENALYSPLLETSVQGARSIAFNITTAPDTPYDLVAQAADIIADAAHPEANIIWGATFDDAMQGAIRITVVATHFDADAEQPHLAGFQFDHQEDVFPLSEDEYDQHLAEILDLFKNRE